MRSASMKLLRTGPALLAIHKGIMSKSIAGQPSQRSLITGVIKA